MKRILLTIFIFIFILTGTFAQYRRGLYGHRAGEGYSILIVGGGPAYMFGDVGGSMRSGLFKGSTFNPASTRGFGTFGYRYIFPNNLSLRINLLYGSFVGTDSLTKLDLRKYNFHSDIFEASFQGEFFILGGPNEIGRSPHSLYVFGGGGLIFQNPVVTGNNRGSDQIKSISGSTPVIPFGIGYELYMGRGFSLGSEFAFRYSFGDFLDGLKTPFSDNNDVLVNFNISVSYNFSLGGRYYR